MISFVTAVDATEHHIVQFSLFRLLCIVVRESIHTDISLVPPMDLWTDYVRFVWIFYGSIR